MEDSVEKYGLDLHCTMMLEEYRATMPVFEKMKEIVCTELNNSIQAGGLYITAMESRIKTEKSLAGKLELKGSKYTSLTDITDILGARVITFYSDEVDKIAAMVERLFDIDWANSVDKRKMHELDSFGYNSLHYICRIPKSMYSDPAYPELNDYRFELQMRSAMQHVWATMYHDTGYKSGVEVPKEYLRNLNRLAGMLELADEQFCLIRTNINDYRRQVQSLVSSGRFEEVSLNGDTFRSYLQLHPFDKLNKRIAAINQAEIHEATVIPYLAALKALNFTTLGDVEKLIRDFSDDAYELAVYQLANTDLDIISSTVAIQDLIVVYVLEHDGGQLGLTHIFDVISGPSPYNKSRAERIVQATSNLKFMNKS